MHQWAGNSLEVLDRRLEDRDYLLGAEFGAADVMNGCTVNMAKVFGVDLGPFPAASRYFERVAERPAFQRAMSD